MRPGLPEPWATRLIHEGNGRLFVDERSLWPNGQFVIGLLVVNTKFLNAHPDLVKNWIRANVELTDWINAHPADAKTLLNQQIQRETGKSLPPAVLEEAFSRMQVTYDPLHTQLLTAAQQAFEDGFLGRQMPDLSHLYDLRFSIRFSLKNSERPSNEHERTQYSRSASDSGRSLDPRATHRTRRKNRPGVCWPLSRALRQTKSPRWDCMTSHSSYRAQSGERLLALDNINLQVKPGEFLCIVGPSGCGKSTLLHLIAGLHSQTSGQILIDGTPVQGPGTDRILIFQEHGLFPWLTVGQNVEFGMKMKGVPKAERVEKTKHYLRLVHLGKFQDSYIHQLSGGMRQRVAHRPRPCHRARRSSHG